MLRLDLFALGASAVLLATAVAACSADDPGGGGDRGDTAAILVGGDELPPSDVEEFTSFDAEQLAETCGDGPQLPSQRVCAMPFLQSPPGTPIVIVRATFPDEQTYFAFPRDDACELDPAACPEPVELTPQDVAGLVAVLDLEVSGSPGLPSPTGVPTPSPTEDSPRPTTDTLPTDALPRDGPS